MLSGLLVYGLQDVRSQDTAKPEVAAFKIESRHVDIWMDNKLHGERVYNIGGVSYVEDRDLAIRVAIEMWENLRSE